MKDVFLDLLLIVATLSALAVLALPIFFVYLFISRTLYERKMVRKADEVRLREATILRLELDDHGLAGHVVDLLSGAITDLDQGDHVAAQKKLAALTGAQGYSKVASEVVEEEAPLVQLPVIMPIPARERGQDANL